MDWFTGWLHGWQMFDLSVCRLWFDGWPDASERCIVCSGWLPLAWFAIWVVGFAGLVGAFGFAFCWLDWASCVLHWLVGDIGCGPGGPIASSLYFLF